MLSIDLYGRYSSAFGYVAGKVAISGGQQRRIPQPIQGVEIYTADATFADLKLKSAKDGKVYEFRNTILTDSESGIFAPPPMLKFTRDKNILTTAVQGSDSVVVEDFGMKQWDITMDGLLVDMDAHQYPTAKVQKFRQLFETPDVFDVLECQVMTDLGINALYFESVKDLAVVDNYPDTVKFKLTAKSIQPPEFTISD